MGYLGEQIAIRSRHRRWQGAWHPHLDASRTAMMEAATHTPAHGLCVVVGAGLCLDVPLAGLARVFSRVVLLDVGFLDRTGPANVERIPFDATGSLARWHADPQMSDDDALAVGDPGWPTGLGDPDLTISASVISQLHLAPAAWLAKRRPRPEDFRERLGATLAAAHLAWLRQRPGRRLLIGDLAEIALTRANTVADEVPMPTAALGLRLPDRTWDWDLAPIPEWDRDLHLRHRVGAWNDP
jgi:hypothetical protein